MRGWWADEKLESGLWDAKIYRLIYNYFKKLEKINFRECDYAISLTNRGKEQIVQQHLAEPDKIGVIPTCVDFETFKSVDADFKKAMREKLGISDAERVFVYSGSIGGNYDSDMLISVFKSFKSVYCQSYLLILSKDPFPPDVKTRFISAGIDRMAIYNLPFPEVTNYLRAADVGFIYYKRSFSVIGRSPTKLGEYWASGLPVITFKGIGDLDYILNRYPGSGILLIENETDWEKEIKSLQFANPVQLREYSEDYFHIDKGVMFYQNVYDRLLLSEN
jgi:glycosyltransferase involved in cell wall biosynthesis